MKYLIVAMAFLFACIAFAPTYAAPTVLMRATTAPQPTSAPPSVPAVTPEGGDENSAPAYPAPVHRRHDAPKPTKPAPGIRCGRCS